MLQNKVKRTLVAVICAAAALSVAAAREPQARGETRFVGEISMIPKNGIGFWRIASRQIVSDALTELVAMRGPMIIGACVQVDMRQQKVLKIETLRQDEC